MPQSPPPKKVYIYEWNPDAGPLPPGAVDCSLEILGDDVLDTDWDCSVEDAPHDRIYAEVNRRAAEAKAKTETSAKKKAPKKKS